MDFTTLIQMAKQNRDTTKDEGKYYKTKLAPPKKETKEAKRLSENIQKFLQKREQEEREKELAQKKKVANLLAMRDEKSKNKIRKMLKVTKSANKSVLDDAITTQTAVTLEGPEQPDQDDYGYVSTEANAFYQKYIEKVKDVKEDKGFAPSRPQSLKDLTGTKDRVKAAITREKEEKMNGQRRSHTSTHNSSRISSNSSSSSSKTLYDPEAERREEEKKREEERKKAKARRPPAPPMDFRELLKLAEKKQHEPIQILQKETRKEPGRLLTLKEKKELEEMKRAKEARERRDRERKEGRLPPTCSATSAASSTKSTPPTAAAVKPDKPSEKRVRPEEKVALKKPASTTTASTKTSAVITSSKPPTNTNLNGKSSQIKAINGTKINGSSKELTTKSQVPTRDRPAVSRPPVTAKRPPVNSYKLAANKRRIIDDDDDEEYDSEMDDFIDDGDDEQDFSSVIKDIFGYDKSKYRDIDDEDDAAMESNFAQIQREELISKKIGLQEDLEDMRLEALEKARKRKMMKKARLAVY